MFKRPALGNIRIKVSGNLQMLKTNPRSFAEAKLAHTFSSSEKLQYRELSLCAFESLSNRIESSYDFLTNVRGYLTCQSSNNKCH